MLLIKKSCLLLIVVPHFVIGGEVSFLLGVTCGKKVTMDEK
jgi:hypothetical protein